MHPGGALIGVEGRVPTLSGQQDFPRTCDIDDRPGRPTHHCISARQVWAKGTHANGEAFALIDASRLREIPVADALLGCEVEVTAHGVGDGAGTSLGATAGGEALRPPRPVHLRAVMSGGALALSWIRRSRLGYAWVDDVDAPLGENSERYRISVAGPSASIEVETTTPALAIAAAQVATLGSGAGSVRVVMVGDRAVSREASLTINLT